MTLKNWLRDVGERAVATFAVAVLALLSTVALTDFDPITFGKTAGTAALVALAAFLKTVAWPAAGFGLTAVQDVLARAAFSFIQVAATVVAADAGFQWYTASAWHVVLASSAAAAFSVVKGAIALRMVDATVTPASLAKAE